MALIAALLAAPAGAQQTAPSPAPSPPASLAYFVGTWRCTSDLHSAIVHAYGLLPDGRVADVDAFVTPAGMLGEFVGTYKADGAGVALSETVARVPVTLTSSGWNGDRLTFAGQVTRASGPRDERMTFTRSAPNGYSRVFERAETPGTWSAISTERCTRIPAG